MSEEQTQEVKEEPKKQLLVLNEVPNIPQRDIVDAEGSRYGIVTRDEALAEILLTVREIKKGIVG